MQNIILLWVWFTQAWAGEQVWGEPCTVDKHCIAHLECIRNKCRPPKSPRAAQCARKGFVYRDADRAPIKSPWDLRKDKADIACPPFCGHLEDVVYGPICVINKLGCALSEGCKKYGKCGFDGKACVTTAEGCKKSNVCKDEGWCSFKKGHCTLSEKSCADSTSCKTVGSCSMGEVLVSGNPLIGNGQDRYAIRCVKTPTGCAEADRCKSMGLCRYVKSTVATCADGRLKCHNPASCVAGPPSPESYPEQ